MKRNETKAKTASVSPEKQLADFIKKFDAKNQSLIRAVRKTLRKRFPTANELVWDNYNFFVIAYSPTERPSDNFVSIAAASNGVVLGFYRGANLRDPHKLLLGNGKQYRFLRLASAATLARPEVEALIAEALAQCTVRMPAWGKGKLLIRSSSSKQRPRRSPRKLTR